MRPVTDLAKLRDSIASRTSRFREMVAPISNPLSPDDRRKISFVIIELDNLILVSLRHYTKSSLLGSRTVAGERITCSVNPQSSQEAAAFIYKSINPTGYINKHSPVSIPEKDEINIRNPKQMEKIFLDYSLSNFSNLSMALSLNALVFSEIRSFRNFFAHRAKNTFEEVEKFASSLGIYNAAIPEDFLIRGRPGMGVRFIDGWLADIDNFFDFAS